MSTPCTAEISTRLRVELTLQDRLFGSMAKDKPPKVSDHVVNLPAHEMLPSRLVEEHSTPTKRIHVEYEKVNEISAMLFFPSNFSEEQRNARIVRALELYEGLAPTDAIEGMLATQMVATHTTAVHCLQSAAGPSLNLAQKDMYLKHAQKLLALYSQQVASLDKHRGKGQQRVTVEHVNVQSGGQAIVGSVEVGSPQSRVSDNERDATVEDPSGRKAAAQSKSEAHK